MPFKVAGLVRKCKYCNKPAKINYFGLKRRHKGYYRTCGDFSCLKMQYKDKSVNQQKKYLSRNIKAICECCGLEYIKVSHLQKWCKECVPDSSARAIIMRYGINRKQYKVMSPFVSVRQRKYMFAKLPALAHKWAKKYGTKVKPSKKHVKTRKSV